MKSNLRITGATVVALVFLTGCQMTETRTGQGGSLVTGSGGAAGAQGETVALPRCARPLGVASLAESEMPTHVQSMGLGSPVPLVRLMVLQSGCFKLVDRGRAFQQMQYQRSLAASGQLQSGSNVGDGQLVAADFILTPSIISQQEDAGGTTASLSSLLPGLAGDIGSNLDMKTKRAETLISVTDARTGVQEAIAQGSAEKRDLAIGGGLHGIGGIDLSVAGGNYENTEIGRITAAAFLDAYGKLVGQVRAMAQRAPAIDLAPAAGPAHSTPPDLPNPNTDYQVVTVLNVRDGPATTAAVISKLDPGSVVVATGKSDGAWWIVKLPNNTFGWVHGGYLRRK